MTHIKAMIHSIKSRRSRFSLIHGIDYLGAVLAQCWIDRGLIDRIDADPHRALRSLGILLPDEIDIKVERSNKTRPRLVIYEFNQSRSFRRRICYLQLIMMAGQ